VAEAANRMTRPRGRVLVFGVPHMGSQVAFDHFRLFREEISIISSYTSLKNSMQAIDLMRTKTIRVDDLVSHQIKLSECPDYIKRMEAGIEDAARFLLGRGGAEGLAGDGADHQVPEARGIECRRDEDILG